jgi:TIR domain
MEVFVSYAHSDTPIARAVAKGLTEEGYKVALADDDFASGDNWALKIGEALERSRALVVLLSPDAVKSDHVRRELEFALTSPQFAHRIFPVMIRPTRGVPWILRKLNMLVTGQNPNEVRKAVLDALRKSQAAITR